MTDHRDGAEEERRPEAVPRGLVLAGASVGGAKPSGLRWVLLIVPGLLGLLGVGLVVRSVLERGPGVLREASERLDRATERFGSGPPAVAKRPPPTSERRERPRDPHPFEHAPPPPRSPPATPRREAVLPEAPKPVPVLAFDGADIVSRIAGADLNTGASAFRVCGVCHTAQVGAGHRIGPQLWGVVGRPKASYADFAYSLALKRTGGRWTYEDLARYLYDTRSAVPGGKMTFAGIKDPDKLAAVIAFMRTLADNPQPLPRAP